MNRAERLLDRFEGSSILLTGATGLIGRNFMRAVLEWNLEHSRKIILYALVRDSTKVCAYMGGEERLEAEGIKLLTGDVRTVDLSDITVQYIVHAASMTSSREFVEKPVEVISVALEGSRHILEYAREAGVKKVVYLSSMEIYGVPQSDEKIDESHGCNLDTMKTRSSYPESKRMCEAMCASYWAEYHVPVTVLRLTQTFGPGVEWNDGRVFAEFGRCIIRKEDIILNTRGETKRCYLHTSDAVQAILTLLDVGIPGEAYNAANEDSYCSIYEMALFVAEHFGGGNVKVHINEDAEKCTGYAPSLHMNLDTKKIRQLGWQPSCDMQSMFHDMLCDLQFEESNM